MTPKHESIFRQQMVVLSRLLVREGQSLAKMLASQVLIGFLVRSLLTTLISLMRYIVILLEHPLLKIIEKLSSNVGEESMSLLSLSARDFMRMTLPLTYYLDETVINGVRLY